MKRSGIYAIKAPSGRMYIGSAANIAVRWRWHRNALARGGHHNAPLQAAFAKYGELEYVVLELCDVAELVEREQAHIDAYAFTDLYNVAQQVEAPMRGLKFSTVHRAKIAAKATGRRHTPEARARMARRHKGKVLTATTRAKMSAVRKGRSRLDIPVGASGLRGVYPVNGRWLAQMRKGTRRVNLGYFETPELAAIVRAICIAWQGPVTV